MSRTQKALVGLDLSHLEDEALEVCERTDVDPHDRPVEDGPGDVQMPWGDEAAVASAPDMYKLALPIICCDCGLSHVIVAEHHAREGRLTVAVRALEEATEWVRRQIALAEDVGEER